MTHDNHNACCTNQNIVLLLPSFVGHKKKKNPATAKKNPILSGTHITSNHDHILSHTTFPPILTPS